MIAADPKHLGAEIGFIAVLHTWGQNLDHHPHIHCIVPGGGVSRDSKRWVPCRAGFFLPVRVLSRLFRRLFLQRLEASHRAGELQFFTDLAHLNDVDAFRAYLGPLRKSEWVVYAKRPFAGPSQVLAYLALYAISNSRLLDCDREHVRFRWKDCRENGRRKHKVMRLRVGVIRRFLMHVVPDGFHRIRHYGLFANGHRAEKIALCRKLLEAPMSQIEDGFNCEAKIAAANTRHVCPCCGGRMNIIETFEGEYVSAGRHHDSRRVDI